MFIKNGDSYKIAKVMSDSELTEEQKKVINDKISENNSSVKDANLKKVDIK